MAKLLLGKEVAAAMSETMSRQTAELRERGVRPRLAIVRCGENPSDMAYERGAEKRAAAVGVEVAKFVLPETAGKAALIAQIERINADGAIHGCLLLRPLPEGLRAAQDEIRNRLAACKDVDGMTDLSGAGVYAGKKLGFAPCTAEACVALLDHYGVDCAGKNAVVIGRSLVVGRPLALLLLARNATVTVCHTKTADTARLARSADIVLSAAGAPGSLTRDFVRAGQVVVDVSVNDDGRGGLAGDAAYEEVEPVVGAITPVPGGVGAVTSAVLVSHVIEAARRTLEG